MKFKNKIIRYLQYKLGNKYNLILNVNCDLFSKEQKRILFCYMTSSFSVDLTKNIFHPNIPRCNQMITSLIKMGYTIDICDSRDTNSFPILKERSYEAIIGFGPIFELMAGLDSIKHKIIYITENDPATVEKKYHERLDYFKERHPKTKIIPTNQRVVFYNRKQIELANYAIIMTNDYNSVYIKNLVPSYFKIKVNGFINTDYRYTTSNISEKRKNFLWFGSTGLYQKGLDILIDVFSLIPDYTLNVYGVDSKELKSIEKLLPPNVIIHSKVSVLSHEFINVMNKNLFIISASCLEGMQSGVATCMRHGLIPMLTKECGYDEHPSIIQFENYKVETIKNKIEEIQKLSDEELAKLSRNIYDYGNSEFTLENFIATFKEGLQSLFENRKYD